MPELFRFVNGNGLRDIRSDPSVDLFDVGDALFDFGCVFIVELCGVFAAILVTLPLLRTALELIRQMMGG